MNTSTAFINQIMAQAEAARDALQNDPTIGSFVDAALPIPRPYVGTGDIRLIIIGQDPTVKRSSSRKDIKTVLNLDKPRNLRSYLAKVCAGLGLSFDEHVYATNVCKCFFKDPPTVIQKRDGIDVLATSAAVWLPILRQEIARFPDAIAMSLGEPVLTVLVRQGAPRLVKHYWGYHRDWRQGATEQLCAIEAADSTVDRLIFPFMHQPSLRKQFYSARLDSYIAFVKERSAEPLGVCNP